jgi:hypothetical protein
VLSRIAGTLACTSVRSASSTRSKPETKQRNKYALNPKNKDGLDSRWQHAAKTLVDDGSGMGTKVRACQKQASCVTCKVARSKKGSDKCNPCALAVFFGT